MVTWFSTTTPPLKDVIRHLYPKRVEERSRFSQLLLEHGEKALEDFDVIASSSQAVCNDSEDQTSQGLQWEQAPRKSRSPRKIKKSSSSTISASSSPASYQHMSKIEGRLHLCTRSLVFEPYDSSRPIVRCPFSKMEQAPKEYLNSDPSCKNMSIEFLASKHLLLKENNAIEPFRGLSRPTHFSFTFLHSAPKMFVDLCREIFQLETKKDHQKVEELIESMVYDRRFDMDNLIDIRERIISQQQFRASIETPLQSKPGILFVTAERVYFQPCVGVLTKTETRAIHWLQKDLVATARRYHGLRDSGLELYFKDETSVLLAFARRHDREQAFHLLPDVVCVTDRDFVARASKEWNERKIDNFEYLLAINSAAGRSFHDLSRYPVYPWVVVDYESSKLDLSRESTFRDLSKPVGALNEERLAYFTNRMSSMVDMGEPFLYGTHYSAPGYVLYFLIRSMPEHMLCLQNGKFDAPDRMFHNMQQCFSCVLKNHADVKELIPEFYNSRNEFDFLINARGLHLGATQNGDRVDDVALPPWARSARDFIKKNRKALESDQCTKMLPRWIDLVFGSKSRGEAALEASNLFHPITYLGPSDLANMQTEQERHTAEIQATEFGIVPDLLFIGEHPLRGDAFDDSFISPSIGRGSSKDELNSNREAWEMLDLPESNSDSLLKAPSDIPSVQRSMSADQAEDSRKAVSLPTPSQDLNPSVSESAAITHSFSFDAAETNINLREAGKWDMKVIERKKIHNEAVSCCSSLLDESGQIMIGTTSLDGGLFFHKYEEDKQPNDVSSPNRALSSLTRFTYTTIMSRGQSFPSMNASKLEEYRTHSAKDPVASLVFETDGHGGYVAFAGGHDDVIIAYGVNSACTLASVYSHRDAVTALALVRKSPFDQESVVWSWESTHILISGSWDGTVKVWSVTISSGEKVTLGREPIAEFTDAASSITCLSATPKPSGGVLICAGCADGSFSVWMLHTDGTQVVLHNEVSNTGSGQCTNVEWMSEGGNRFLIVCFSNGKLASYRLNEKNLKRVNAVSVGVGILSLSYTSPGIVLVGCSDGALRLIPIQPDGRFEHRPTVWEHVVNHKSSPSISSLCTISREGSGTRLTCCAGGEDGSLALFDLNQAEG